MAATTRKPFSAQMSLDLQCSSCMAVFMSAELCSHISSSNPRLLPQVFAIDEAQFFGDLLEFCVRAADTEGKLVLVAGLDGDFRRQRFGQARRTTLWAAGHHVTSG